jgi:hypothetical protein
MFERLLGEALGPGDPRVLARTRFLAESELLCLGRHTISGLLTTCGQQDRDWSAPYRLFERGRVDNSRLFATSRRVVCGLLVADAPLVAMLDDTLFKKRGRKVAGTSWRRDPLGPRFCNNIIWAQRFLQVSAALPESAEGPSRARGVPISLLAAPSPRKPSRKAAPEEWVNYRAELKASALSRRGAEQLSELRNQLDQDPENAGRQLVVTVDGGYTNGTVLRRLPDRVTVIGRIRKDAKLYAPPIFQPGRGRKRLYGEQMPTPEQLRQDESVPWEKVAAYAAGQVHQFQVKSFAPCRWKAAGARDVRVVVIRPLAYRPNRNSRVLYRQPGYLLCTDPRLPLDKIIQYYVWRWEIELNFREEKTLLGAGEAQVRNPQAVVAAPGFKVAVYALLLAANALCNGSVSPPPRPKWQKQAGEGRRMTTQQMIGLMRAEIWGRAMGVNNFDGFVNKRPRETKPLKINHSPAHAVIYAFR